MRRKKREKNTKCNHDGRNKTLSKNDIKFKAHNYTDGLLNAENYLKLI